MTKWKSSGQKGRLTPNHACSAQHSSIATARATPKPATSRPGRPCPPTRVVSAVRATLKNESGSLPSVGGTRTYCLRPSQKITVAMPIRMPGMPNATAGP